MSVMKNSFEERLVNSLQMQMSKREAEEALYEIREALGGKDRYDQISPKIVIEQSGKMRKEYPPIKKIIWAYFNDRFDVFEVEEKEEKIKKIEPPKKEKVAQKPQQQMTKKQRKAAMWAEVGRLTKAIPHMGDDFAMQIALHNLDNPDDQISDDFLLKVVKKGQEMDVWGEDAHAASRLHTHNSNTNWNSLKALMGDELFNEMLKCGVNWGYFASLYDSIYRSKFKF